MKMKETQHLGKRTLMALAGVVLTGFGVGGLQKASFGVDPFTSVVTGIANMFHSDYGTIYPIVTVILLVLTFIFNRRLIGISTILNLVAVSGTAGVMKKVLDWLIPEDTMVLRIIVLLITLIIVCFSASLYYTADLGVSAYDAIALTLSGKYKVSSFRVCRVGSDVFCCFVGFVSGVTLGIGTVITAFMMGPVIQWFNIYITEKYIYKKD